MSQLKLAFTIILLSLLFIFGMSVTCNLTHQMVCYTEPSVNTEPSGKSSVETVWKRAGTWQVIG